MNEITDVYAKALLDCGCTVNEIDTAAQRFSAYPDLRDVLSNPVIALEEKERVIAKLFPASMHRFFTLLCQNGRIAEIGEIFRSCRSEQRRRDHCIKATVEYVTPLTQEQQEKIIQFVKKKTGYPTVELSLVENPSLIGGFILRAGDFRYDRSSVRTLTELRKKTYPEVSDLAKHERQ